jgi:hypothetical protein
MLGSQIGQDAAQRADVRIDAVQRIAHLQRDGGVHDVLRGRAPVDVAPGLAAHRHELVHQRQDRVADDVGLLAHVVEVDALDSRFAGDGGGRLGRDHADARLGLGQRDLDVDVALHERAVGKHLAHRLGAEGVAEQGGIDDGAGRRNRVRRQGLDGHGASLCERGGLANMFEHIDIKYVRTY